MIERLFELWKTESLDQVLSLLQAEVEKTTGSLADMEHVEKLFIEQEKDGNIWDIETIRQYVQLHRILKTIHAPEHPLVDFLDVFMIWQQGYVVDTQEDALDADQTKILNGWIKKINTIKNSKYLFFFIKKENEWVLDKIYNMQDYENGTVSYMDLKIRKMLMNHIKEEIRLILLACGERGEYCIEL